MYYLRQIYFQQIEWIFVADLTFRFKKKLLLLVGTFPNIVKQKKYWADVRLKYKI